MKGKETEKETRWSEISTRPLQTSPDVGGQRKRMSEDGLTRNEKRREET
jgi:hypothetical protein